MTQDRVRITGRRPSGTDGYDLVYAFVDDGDTGEYVVATRLAGTADEINEILAQSQSRQDTRAILRFER